MQFMSELMPIIIYILLSILIIISIVLVLKLIMTLKKIDILVDDMNIKMSKLNGIFDIIDNSTKTVKTIVYKILEFIKQKIIKKFRKGD